MFTDQAGSTTGLVGPRYGNVAKLGPSLHELKSDSESKAPERAAKPKTALGDFEWELLVFGVSLYRS